MAPAKDRFEQAHEIECLPGAAGGQCLPAQRRHGRRRCQGRTAHWQLCGAGLRAGKEGKGMIPQSYIEELVQRSDMVDVAQSYVQLRRRGRTYTGLCPLSLIHI